VAQARPVLSERRAKRLAKPATVATLPFTPENAVDTYWILPIRKDSALDAAGVRAALGLATANLDTQLVAIQAVVDDILVDTGTTLPAILDTIDNFLDTEIAAILADTNELQTDWVNGGRLDLLIDLIKAATDQFVFTTPGQVDATAVDVSDKTGYAIGTGGIAAAAFAANAVDAAALATDAVTEIVAAIFARAFSAASCWAKRRPFGERPPWSQHLPDRGGLVQTPFVWRHGLPVRFERAPQWTFRSKTVAPRATAMARCVAKKDFPDCEAP